MWKFRYFDESNNKNHEFKKFIEFGKNENVGKMEENKKMELTNNCFYF